MRALSQRLAEWGERRLPALTRYRRMESLPVELHRRRIYIVPTGFGVGFAALLLVMLIGALNYANNAALLLTCLLSAASASSMLMTFRNLNGLRLSRLQNGHATAGDPIEVSLLFESERARNAVRVDTTDTRVAFSTATDGTARITILLPTAQRGWQPMPRLRVWTTWPLGLFRAWSWLRPENQILVWPRAEPFGPVPRTPESNAQQTRRRAGDELTTFRDYRAGDPQRHIAWKISAHHESLLVKDFAQPQSQPQWQLDWREIRGLDNEMRISRLARWLGEAQAQRHSYSLWLPDNAVPLGSGPLHYVHCMNALAQMP